MAEDLRGDDGVQATNDDAVSGKRCAVQLGYWSDPYLQHFCRNAERKAPEMNRGYYARTQTVKALIERVIKMTNCNCQIVNLGAGYDTLYWRLKDENLRVTNFTEVDFPNVTANKCYMIKRSKILLQSLANGDGDIRMSSSELHAKNYHLVGADLRNMNDVSLKLTESEVDTNVTTIFLAECVLVYLQIHQSDGLLKWITEKFPSAFFINYEQVNMVDRFGSVMIDNLKTRGCDLAGVAACSDLQAQENRFLKTGWETAKALDMLRVYYGLPSEELSRIEKLEFLDERELMEQLFSHYCICIAAKDGLQVGLSKVDF